MVVSSKRVRIALVFVATIAATLTDAPRASAVVVDWSAPLTCAVNGTKDYVVETGWVRSGASTSYYITKFWVRSGVGRTPPAVYRIQGFELYQTNGPGVDGVTTLGFPAAHSGTIYFPRSLAWMRASARPYAVTFLLDANKNEICGLYTQAP